MSILKPSHEKRSLFKPGKSWITTPHDIAHGIAPGLARSSVVAKLDGKTLWDMTRPLEESHKIEFLKFENDEAREVFWHSSAHVIGEAMESFLGGKLVFGPPVENGFYYDIDSEFSVSDKDFGAIEKVVQKIVKENQPFERLMISKEDLLRMFDYNVSILQFRNRGQLKFEKSMMFTQLVIF